MIDRLVTLVTGMGNWAYVVIVAAVTLEAAVFLGFLIPGETMVVLGGFLAAQGVLDLGTLILLASIGAAVGDSVGYEVGRRFGSGVVLRFGGWAGLRQSHLDRVRRFFDAHGGKAVVMGRFTAILRALTPFVAGTSHMPYSRFVVYNVVGGVVWTVAFVLLGYFVGESWRVAERWVSGAGLIVLGLLAGVALTLIFRRKRDAI